MSLGLYVRFPTVYRPVLFMPSYGLYRKSPPILLNRVLFEGTVSETIVDVIEYVHSSHNALQKQGLNYHENASQNTNKTNSLNEAECEVYSSNFHLIYNTCCSNMSICI